MKIAVTVTLKKDVLDPQGKVVQHTIQNMGISAVKSLRQGKYFEIEIEGTDEKKNKSEVEIMCQKLLVNLIIEDYKITKL